jgi:hypothetical protein
VRFPRKKSRIKHLNLMQSFDVTNHLRTILPLLGERAGVRASSL